MSITTKAIIDTSVLISLYYLKLLKFLKLIYAEVRIPRAVEEEFLTQNKDEKEITRRNDFLLLFYAQNSSWFLPCSEYGIDLVKFYLTDAGLDLGEAEALSQNQYLGNISDVLLDERKARKHAKSTSIKHHGVLYILASLDLKFKCCNYFECVNKLKTETSDRFSEKVIKLAYKKVREEIFKNN